MIVVGHRGWPLAYPENTLASFEAALKLGVDAIELDVHVTTDNRIVVIHDDTVDRTSDGTGAVRDMTLEQLRRLDAGAKFAPRFAGQRIPTLEEAMDLVAGKVPLAIEVKPPGPTEERLDAALWPLLEAYGGEFIIHSFDAGYLERFHRAHPEVFLGFLCGASTESIARAVEIGCKAIHPAWQTLTPELNAAARAARLHIMVWIARTQDDCRHIAHLDVDAVGADCPDVMMKVLGEEEGVGE